MIRAICLDLNGETFDQRIRRMPDKLKRKHLVFLRLFETVEAVSFAIKMKKLPYLGKGKNVYFKKEEIRKWLKTREI
jgi:hypothetical protein